jgi:hypothetical protein
MRTTLPLQFWVDRPITDLMAADQVAFDIFARISIEMFYSERRFVEGAIVYTFVTGTSRHGHSGSVVLAGPHAAEFSNGFASDWLVARGITRDTHLRHSLPRPKTSTRSRLVASSFGGSERDLD